MTFFSWFFGIDAERKEQVEVKEPPKYEEETFIVKDKMSVVKNSYEYYYFLSDKNKGYQLNDNFIENMFTWKNAKNGDMILRKKHLRGEYSGRISYTIYDK
jgi:hypothetical protein